MITAFIGIRLLKLRDCLILTRAVRGRNIAFLTLVPLSLEDRSELMDHVCFKLMSPMS
jgi:hypothetical protein